MKTIYDKLTRDEVISRINSLSKSSARQWGQMNVNQMMGHCILWEEMVSGKLTCKRSFIGRLIGKRVLKRFLKQNKPMMRNAISSPELIVNERNWDIPSKKERWISLIEENVNVDYPFFIHPFFGKMTKEQVGYLAYAHIDHHLRQFNS